MSKDKKFQYLTELSNAGVVNIDAAVPYLRHQFPDITEEEAKSIIKEWTASKFLTE